MLKRKNFPIFCILSFLLVQVGQANSTPQELEQFCIEQSSGTFTKTAIGGPMPAGRYSPISKYLRRSFFETCLMQEILQGIRKNEKGICTNAETDPACFVRLISGKISTFGSLELSLAKIETLAKQSKFYKQTQDKEEEKLKILELMLTFAERQTVGAHYIKTMYTVEDKETFELVTLKQSEFLAFKSSLDHLSALYTEKLEAQKKRLPASGMDTQSQIGRLNKIKERLLVLQRQF